MTISVKQSGAYNESKSIKSKVNGVYQRVAGLYPKIAGAYVSAFGNSAALPAFTFQSETQSFIAAQTASGTTPNSRRQKNQNRLIKRLKAIGSWGKISHLYLLATDSAAQALINVRNPGVNNLVVNGTPTFTANTGYAFPTIASFLNTGVAPSSLNQNDVSMACFTRMPTGTFATSSYNMGSTDAGGSNGLSLVCTNGKVPAAANMGFIGGGTVTSDQDGMQLTNRTSATNTELYHNSRLTDVFTNASASPAAITAPITIGKVNGRTTTCLQTITAAFIGTGLTVSEAQNTYAAIQDYVDKVVQGDMDIYDAGFAPAVVSTFDHVVYGLAPGALMHAYQLARDGESVCVVGGWRDHHGNIGGMSAGGLGFADYKSFATLSGIAKTMVTNLNAAMGVANTNSFFVPRYFLAELRRMFDGARTNGFSIPIFMSGGIVAVQKSGTRLTNFSTADGRTFAGKYFHDGTYEGDLLGMSGVTFNIGREAAGTGTDAYNGNRGLADKAILSVNVSPRVIDGDDTSALLPEIEFDTTPVGAADDRIQAYNFRLTWILSATRKLPFANVPPPGYQTSTYEIGLRGMAQGISTTMLDFFKIDNTLPLGHYDLNTSGIWSTDRVSNKGRAYTQAATYEAREVEWQALVNYTKGLMHLLCFDADPRVTPSIRAQALTWGYDTRHYLDQHPNDSLHWNPQMYVREFRRMISSFVLKGSDCTRASGTTPRNTNTICALSYTIDSHVNRYLVDTTVSPNKIVAEGGVGIPTGIVPFPYEASVPLQSECSNLSVSFCVSADHLGFGVTRMEYHAMLIGQATAVAARLSRLNGEADLQLLPYATLRPALLAVQDAVPPNLPQLN